ncbi:hypothetical protein [Citrobacter freundii]|uniref:hypothetical protein n=1 Tax=Citrobacter freundii TaxID=546 RepID=UPI002E1145CC
MNKTKGCLIANFATVPKNSLNRLIRCVCGKKIGPDPRNFNQRVSLGRNDLLIRTFLSKTESWH